MSLLDQTVSNAIESFRGVVGADKEVFYPDDLPNDSTAQDEAFSEAQGAASGFSIRELCQLIMERSQLMTDEPEMIDGIDSAVDWVERNLFDYIYAELLSAWDAIKDEAEEHEWDREEEDASD